MSNDPMMRMLEILPADDAFPITPSDSQDLPVIARGIYVGGGGDIAIATKNGQLVTLVGASSGIVLPIRVKRVYSTGTTATNLVALY